MVSKINLEINILNKFEFDMSEITEIKSKLIAPNNIGVYAIKSARDYLYIGMSTNLRSRLSDHLVGPFSSEINSITVYITENNVYADILETFLIAKYVPKYNKAKIPMESVSIVDMETELVELDERIELLSEQKEELSDECASSVFVEDSCVGMELKVIEDEIDVLRLDRKRLRDLGAKPLDNTSNFAIAENNMMSSIYWKMKQRELLDGV